MENYRQEASGKGKKIRGVEKTKEGRMVKSGPAGM